MEDTEASGCPKLDAQFILESLMVETEPIKRNRFE